MYKCEICGRVMKHKIKLHGYILCNKHMHQLLKYGKFLDNIQRTNNDLNDYIVKNDMAVFNIYNQKNIKNGEFFIDVEDIEKVRYKKWRISHQHIVTGLPYHMKNKNKKCRDLSHVILDIDTSEDANTVIDHIDGNAFNNCKSNLRICTQAQNVLNKSFVSNNTSNFIGIYYDKTRNTWDAEIRYQYKRWHLGRWVDKKNAVYARLIAEQYLFKDFMNNKELQKQIEYTKNIDYSTKQNISQYVIKKLCA